MAKNKKTSLLILLVIVAVVLAACSQRTEEEVKIYVANEGSSSISVISAKSLKVIKTVQLTSSTPHNVNIDPLGRYVYVTNHEEEEEGMEMKHIPYLRILDAKNYQLLKSVMMPEMAAHVVPSKKGEVLYVSIEGSDKIVEVDISKVAVVRTFNAGEGPHGFVLSNDGRILYVPNMRTNDLSIVDIPSGKEERIVISFSENNCETPVATGITKDDNYVFVSCGTSFDAYKIDTVAKKAIARVEFKKGEFPGPIQMPLHPDGKYLYVPDMRNGVLHKIDADSFKIIKDIPSGRGAHGIAYSADGKRAYVTNTWDDTVSVIDLENEKTIKAIKVGHKPNGIAVSNGKNQGW